MSTSPYDRKKNNKPPAKLTNNKATREEIKNMGAIHMTRDKMAYLLGVAPSTLNAFIAKHPMIKALIEEGKALSGFNVRTTAYNMATSGKNPDMTKFWLKTQEGFRENDRLELTGKDGEDIKIMTKTQQDQEIEKLMDLYNRFKDK